MLFDWLKLVSSFAIDCFISELSNYSTLKLLNEIDPKIISNIFATAALYRSKNCRNLRILSATAQIRFAISPPRSTTFTTTKTWSPTRPSSSATTRTLIRKEHHTLSVDNWELPCCNIHYYRQQRKHLAELRFWFCCGSVVVVTVVVAEVLRCCGLAMMVLVRSWEGCSGVVVTVAVMEVLLLWSYLNCFG